MLYQPKVLKTIKSERGFLVVPVHFRHDPAKDDLWEAQERAKYALKADADRELDFDTRQVLGAPAYPQFLDTSHVVDHLSVQAALPLCLSCDFNVSPMVWNISQIVRGKLLVIDEICIDPADVSAMVLEFRNRYPAHRADVHVYGDATGSGRSPQNILSCYDEIELGLRGYPGRVVLKVPVVNPPQRERLATVNNKLKSRENGEIGVYVARKCRELILDLEEVVTEADGNSIHKTKNSRDPYFKRTHASDGLGYLITREWPIYQAVINIKERRKHRKRYTSSSQQYSRVIGDI